MMITRVPRFAMAARMSVLPASIRVTISCVRRSLVVHVDGGGNGQAVDVHGLPVERPRHIAVDVTKLLKKDSGAATTGGTSRTAGVSC